MPEPHRYDIDSANHFSEIILNAQILKELLGLIYNIDETSHNFIEITKHLDSLDILTKPIYIDEKHHYGEDGKTDHGVRYIHGPVYVKENAKHNYLEKLKPPDLQAIYLKGPTYINDDYKHHNSAVKGHVETLKYLK